jgi:hypothetical protein
VPSSARRKPARFPRCGCTGIAGPDSPAAGNASSTLSAGADTRPARPRSPSVCRVRSFSPRPSGTNLDIATGNRLVSISPTAPVSRPEVPMLMFSRFAVPSRSLGLGDSADRPPLQIWMNNDRRFREGDRVRLRWMPTSTVTSWS